MHRQDPPFSDLHPNFWEVYYTLAGVFATIALGALATLKASLLRLSQRLEEQRDSSQGLLESLFPSRVVERLRSGERRIADARPEATIVFVDLVGFTAVSERVGPSHLIELLENIFWHIDEAAERHGVEKIKTVGDAYMAAAGVTREPTPHDAEMCANFALEVIELIPLISTTVGYEMQARAGIHNGPVIAGIMGKAKTVYDVWGSAVNLASRLESTAGANEILISEPAYWRLQDSFYCEAVGKTDLKGRGPTDVYRLMGKRRDTKPRAPAPDEPQDNVVQLHQAAPNAQGDTQ
jgi:class 3 adenylate cyclase